MIRADAFVDHYRAPLVRRLPSWVVPATVATVAVLMIILTLTTISARHRARAAEQAACAARIETYYARNPRLLAGRVRLAEPCTELRAITF